MTKKLNDYAKDTLQIGLNILLEDSLDSVVCTEKVKNKKQLLKELKPKHDFYPYTTQMPNSI